MGTATAVLPCTDAVICLLPKAPKKWAAPRAVLARPSRSRDISTSPVPAAMAGSG